MNLATLLLCNALSGILCMILAKQRRRSIFSWFLIAMPFGILALFLLLCLPENPSRTKTIDS